MGAHAGLITLGTLLSEGASAPRRLYLRQRLDFMGCTSHSHPDAPDIRHLGPQALGPGPPPLHPAPRLPRRDRRHPHRGRLFRMCVRAFISWCVLVRTEFPRAQTAPRRTPRSRDARSKRPAGSSTSPTSCSWSPKPVSLACPASRLSLTQRQSSSPSRASGPSNTVSRVPHASIFLCVALG